MSDEEKKTEETQEPNTEEDKTSENENDKQDEDVKSLAAQKKHWREKAEKAQAELKTFKEKVAEVSEVPKEKEEALQPKIEERLEAVEFMAQHKEFDAEDYEAAHAISRGRGVSLTDAIKDPLFVAHSEKKASEKQVSEATPTVGRAPKVQPEKPIDKMDEDEHRAYFNKVEKALGD